MIPFVEKIAISERWSLKKYIGVLEDIINVSNMSEGDLKTLRTIQAISFKYAETKSHTRNNTKKRLNKTFFCFLICNFPSLDK